MAEFTVYPAIDLRQGQVVRLEEGDPSRQTTYDRDPAAAARRWLEAGARWLHVVNLDGAFGETGQANQAALQAVLREAAPWGARVQFGGGLRSLVAIEQALGEGVSRVILGTAAVEQPELLGEALGRWGSQRVAVSLDARGGWVQVRGWQDGSSRRAVALAKELAGRGVTTVIYTDVSRDGLGQGLNLAATAELAQASGLRVIASGGLRSIEEIRQARELGLAGVIAGKALYAGWIDPAGCFEKEV